MERNILVIIVEVFGSTRNKSAVLLGREIKVSFPFFIHLY